MELDAIIAAPAKTGNEDEWQIAMDGLDTYAGDPVKEASEEREFVLERKRFAEQAIAKGLAPWGSVWGVVSAQVVAQETPALIKDIQEEVVNPLLKARAGFSKLQARRDRHEENGVRTDNSWPCNVAPTLVEHINLYLDWISKNYPEVQTGK